MKANELMIGDAVMYQGDGKIYHISEIGKCNVQFAETPKDTYRSVSVNHIDPIPLTPKILEKNGFSYMGEEYPFEDYYEGFGLHIYGGNFGDRHSDWHINCGTNVSMDVTYAHRLQHALKLCCIVKEITL